jgi:hypothetical protein
VVVDGADKLRDNAKIARREPSTNITPPDTGSLQAPQRRAGSGARQRQ